MTVFSNIAELSVSELSQTLKRVVETNFDLVRVRGEISGFKRAASGHLYMSLKDESAVIDAVCWRGATRRLECTPEDGLDVVMTGKLTTFAGRSKYQLIIEQMQVAGLGALMKLYEERRRKLAAEGLFDEDRKKPLPYLPAVIGVVTSPTGAVIRDIIHRVSERFPRRLLLWPVLVQGDGAAGQIAAAIRGFNQFADNQPIARPDVLIVARGGGSIEDLWPFNEEIVARAAAESEIPLISAVGHETDTTLIDFASDLRAPTPTAAAELAVPVRRELLATLEKNNLGLLGAIDRLLKAHARHLLGLARGIPEPRMMVGYCHQRLDDQGERLALAALNGNRNRRSALAGHAGRLRSPRDILARQRERLHHSWTGMVASVGRMVQLERERLRNLETRPETLARRRLGDSLQALGHLASMIETLSHKNVLERGYAIVRSASSSRLIARLQAAEMEAALSISFADGDMTVVPAARPTKPPAEAKSPADAKPQTIASPTRSETQTYPKQGTLL